MAPKMSKKEQAAAKAAALMAERQKAAENAFALADKDGSGNVDAGELQLLLIGMLQREGIKCEREVVSEFVEKEFSTADTDGSGEVDFDEFVAYYNSLVDRLTEGALNDALAAAKKEAILKAEEAAKAQDDGVYVALNALLQILGAPSVAEYSGLTIPFKLRDGSEFSTPNPEHGVSSRGLILDLSRRAQRLLTPWGSLPIGYRLGFTGYQEKAPPAEEKEGAKPKGKKPLVPWPVIPTPSTAIEPENSSLFFEMTKMRLDSGKMLVLRKVPNRCHFQVVELLGKAQPAGEALSYVSEDTARKLKQRWADAAKPYPRPPTVDMMGGPEWGPKCAEDYFDGAKGMCGPVVNMLVRGTTGDESVPCVIAHKEKFEQLRKRKEVTSRAAHKRFVEKDMEYAMLRTNNDPEKAIKKLVEMQRAENNTLNSRMGHATREGTRYALETCNYNEALATVFLVNQESALKQKQTVVMGRLGMASGLGYPTEAEVQHALVKADFKEGEVMASLKREWKARLEMMAECIAAAEIEEMLTPVQCDEFGFSLPHTADELKHVENLYLSEEFGRDREKVIHFLKQGGAVLRKSMPKPDRAEVEALLRAMDTDAEKVLSFLAGVQAMVDVANKNGSPTRDDCKRYLTNCGRDGGQAMEFMKTIWKLANPKAPKAPAKGNPKPFYAEMCGFPSTAECEWALMSTWTPATSEKPAVLQIDKAVELLSKLNAINEEVKTGTYAGCKREDVLWSLDVDRGKRLLRARPITAEDRKAGANDASSVMLLGISMLMKMGQEEGLKIGRRELLESLEKFDFNFEKAKSWLHGVGTLMGRQAELGFASREEVEEAMEQHELDDKKVIVLFQEAAELASRRAEIGNFTRDDLKAMLTLAWTRPDRQVVTERCLKTWCKLMADETLLLTLFGATPGPEELAYLRSSLLRFNGDEGESLGYLNKVSNIVSQGEKLGNPSRQLVVDTLEEHNLDEATARKVIREEYHRVRGLELKEQYRKNKSNSEVH